MSLLTTYTEENKATSVGLAIRYTVDLVDYAYYRITRTATKRYCYKGMTQAAAEACRLAKIAQYTNEQSILEFSPGVSLPTRKTRTRCMAQVGARCDHGESWRCDIAVNETDLRGTSDAPTDCAALFAEENARSYDETAFGVSLTSVVVESSRVVAAFVAALDPFDPARLILEHKPTETTETWTACSCRLSSDRQSLVIDDPTGYAAGQFFRLVYGSLVSSVVTSVEG